MVCDPDFCSDSVVWVGCCVVVVCVVVVCVVGVVVVPVVAGCWSCFSERYSGQTNRVARSDIVEMIKLRDGDASALGEFPATVVPEFFLDTVFRPSTARTATLDPTKALESRIGIGERIA